MLLAERHFKAKGILSLRNHRVRGLRNIAIHALLYIIVMLPIALTAINWGSQNR